MDTKLVHGSRFTVYRLRNKKILITAGPTWVPIDNVRVISNVASGETGILLAKGAIKAGAKVTLLLGPVNDCSLPKAIKVIRFKFFDELMDNLNKELRSKKYDVLIHSAAVADYRSSVNFKRKISSGLKNLTLKLTPTPKLIDKVKKIDPSLFLVGFKFKPQAQKEKLIAEARGLIKHSGADLVVANTIFGKRYSAYIVNRKEMKNAVNSRAKLAKALIDEIGGALCPSSN